MLEARCYGSDDFKSLLRSSFNKIRPGNEKEKEVLQERYIHLMKEAPEMWNRFVKENQSIYNRQGYLDVILHDDFSFERKKLHRGRPKEKKTKGHRLNVRLDENLFEILQEYCQSENISESEAIRQLIQQLKFRN